MRKRSRLAAVVIGAALVAGVGGGAAAARLAAGEPAAPAATSPYPDDSAIVRILDELGDNAAAYLPPTRSEGKGMELVPGFAKSGPKVRDYGNKLAYAPDRGTGMYCGANHGVPHRLNDVSEYHLGSNTWHLLAPPGTDATRLRGLQNEAKKLSDAVAKGADVEKNQAALEQVRAQMKAWYQGVEVKDGYLQDKANGGPVEPWHTWDGLTYDENARQLCWAVLDSDNLKDERNRVHRLLTRRYAEATGQDAEKLLAQIKPGSSMYLYDPAKDRWFRQLGEGPFPMMRGMGGSLTYIPELKKTIWYCAAQNVSPNDFAMWAWDSAANTWADLKPNGGKSIMTLVHTDKVAPGSEVQMAYSPKHRKLVAVLGKSTFVYDLETNAWARACDDERNQASDSATVFAYDRVGDVFLLLNDYKGQWDLARELRAFSLTANKWETLEPKGGTVQKREYCGTAGYYDPAHNVFVVYNSTERVWVYRYKKAGK